MRHRGKVKKGGHRGKEKRKRDLTETDENLCRSLNEQVSFDPLASGEESGKGSDLLCK
jgi:hypothetical protein